MLGIGAHSMLSTSRVGRCDMPVYTYKCHICDKHEDRYQTSYDLPDDIITCYECGGIMVRALTTPNFHVKGHSSKNNYNYKPSSEET
jgi:putative FmdB family regulatory protein